MKSQIARKVHCTQEHHSFKSTKHCHLTLCKPYDVLNLAAQNVFYIQSHVESTLMYNLGSTNILTEQINC